MRWPDPGRLVRRAGFLARRDPPRAPACERVLVAVGDPGAFAGFPSEARNLLAGDRLLAAALVAGSRFHVLPRRGLDLLLFAPTNLGDFNRDHVFPYLDAAFEALAPRARHAALVEYGSAPELAAPLALVRAEGDPVAGAPALALSLAGWRGTVGTHLRPGLAADAGPLEIGFLHSVVLVALRDDPVEARRALSRAARDFGTRQARLDRVPGAVPEECLVLDLARGVARNDRGAALGLAAPGVALAP